MKPLIKICGIKDLNILNQLIELEAIDFIGFIFFEKSPRNVSNNFLNIVNGINLKNKRAVCVYVDASQEFIQQTSSNFQNPILQFHGNESNDFCKSFNKDFWKVIRVKDSNSINIVSDYPDASAILFENYTKGLYGGTGSVFDWSLLKNINKNDKKIIISGGINIENVDNAISVNPWCIDINSGVETSPGVKDLDLIKQVLQKF
jgi:phosphoribosylanthranilate isomerase|tara:strand:- start:605 stop:1216 length:612 start_codon:yes stop_codon:yes gene_type:complete